MIMDQPKARRGPLRPASPITPDPVEIAMEIAASGKTPADAALAVLHANAALMHDQAGLTRKQLVLASNEIFRNRIRAIRDIALAFMVVALIVAAVAVVWRASQDRSLVIQALKAPPDLVGRGLTGEVLASKLLDRLAEIDANADSLRAPETFRNDWGDDVQIDIPQTGVSIGELDRYLRQWLGERTSIGGEVVRNADGTLSLTVRAGSRGAATQTGSEAELEVLLQQAAEAVFLKTQPFRYSKYLEA